VLSSKDGLGGRGTWHIKDLVEKAIERDQSASLGSGGIIVWK
jgi:hypothetical protein